MSTSFTLATLESFVKETVEDGGTEFDTSFDLLLKLGEDQCVVDLNLDIWKVNDTIALTQASQVGTLPTGFLRLLSLFYTALSSRVFMEQRSFEYLIDYWPSTADQGAPLYWAPYTTTQIFVAPVPNAAYTGTGRGLKRPVSLVIDTGGTWLSQNCGRLLYLATLVGSEQFNVADERIAMWKTEYAEELGRKRFELRHLITPEYALPDLPQPVQGK